MSFYSNGGWGAYGMQGATQGPNFYGVQPQRGSFMPSQYAGASMQNISSFYADMQRKDSFYAEGAPPLTTSAAATAALSANPRTLGSGNQLGSMSYYGELASTPATVTPAAPAEPDTPRDTPTPLQRKNSSGRILRRKVSFSGVPQTLPPEVEPRSMPQTPKRKGSRRLSATPQPTEGDDYGDGHDNDGEGVRGGGQQQQRYPQHYHQQLYQQYPQNGVQQSHFEGPPQLAGDPQQPPFWMQGPSSRPPSVEPQPPEQTDSYQPEQQQPTLAASGFMPLSRRGSLCRNNSTVMPYNGGRVPSAYAPCMQNYALVPFPRPVFRPAFPVYRSVPYVPYNGNANVYPRPPMANYF